MASGTGVAGRGSDGVAGRGVGLVVERSTPSAAATLSEAGKNSRPKSVKTISYCQLNLSLNLIKFSAAAPTQLQLRSSAGWEEREMQFN